MGSTRMGSLQKQLVLTGWRGIELGLDGTNICSDGVESSSSSDAPGRPARAEARTAASRTAALASPRRAPGTGHPKAPHDMLSSRTLHHPAPTGQQEIRYSQQKALTNVTSRETWRLLKIVNEALTKHLGWISVLTLALNLCTLLTTE